MKIELGNKVKDKITEFTGIATAKIEYINGTVKYLVEPKCKEGEIMSGEYIEKERLIIEDKGINIKKSHLKKVGF